MRWMRNNFLSCCFNVECFYFEAIIKSRARTTSVPKRAANCCNANILKTVDEEKSSDGFPLLFVPEMQAVIIEIFRTNTTPHRNTSTILFLLVLTDLIRKYFFFRKNAHNNEGWKWPSSVARPSPVYAPFGTSFPMFTNTNSHNNKV